MQTHKIICLSSFYEFTIMIKLIAVSYHFLMYYFEGLALVMVMWLHETGMLYKVE